MPIQIPDSIFNFIRNLESIASMPICAVLLQLPGRNAG
jgi:hypothetical protein